MSTKKAEKTLDNAFMEWVGLDEACDSEPTENDRHAAVVKIRDAAQELLHAMNIDLIAFMEAKLAKDKAELAKLRAAAGGKA